MRGQSDDMVQLLTPEGQRVPHGEFEFAGTTEDLIAYHRDMVLGRRFDVEATALQRHGELGLWPPQIGQEAAQVGAAYAVRDNDMVFPSYREHTLAMILGFPMTQILALFRGCDHGDWEMLDKFRNYQIVIGCQTLNAVGYAMGLQFDGMVGNEDPAKNAATLVFHGDGASSQGDVNEAYVFAASYNAPVVFFCQNNQWAISEPIALQSRIPLYQRAWGFGFHGVQVDGNDVLAVKAVTDWAMERARQGEGPTFIEAFTYRMGAHTTSDDPTKYRRREEEAAWRAKDPIERVTTYLLGRGAIDQAWLDSLAEESEALGVRIRGGVGQLPEPRLEDFWALTYASLPPGLAQQRDEYLAYEASFDEEPA